MLSNHIYWNVGAFVNKKAQRVLDNTLYLPYSQCYVQVEIDQVPDGKIRTVAGTYLDYTKPTLIGSQINRAFGNCGINCTGYNNAYIIDRLRYFNPEWTDLSVLSMSSPDQ
jgi:aldose 1-epimerase